MPSVHHHLLSHDFASHKNHFRTRKSAETLHSTEQLYILFFHQIHLGRKIFRVSYSTNSTLVFSSCCFDARYALPNIRWLEKAEFLFSPQKFFPHYAPRPRSTLERTSEEEKNVEILETLKVFFFFFFFQSKYLLESGNEISFCFSCLFFSISISSSLTKLIIRMLF